MPSGSEKDVLIIIAQDGGESTLRRVIRKMPCYSAQYVRCVVRSLGTHDYLDWKASGLLTLTGKGRQSLGLSEEDWQAMVAEKEAKEKEEAKIRGRILPMVGSEMGALKKIHKLGSTTKEELSRGLNISTPKAGLLLQSLMKRDYISGNGSGKYQLTPEGLSSLQG